MKVKKFICSQCGAPKVKPYKGLYVVCDYCATMIDIDYYGGLEVYQHSEQHKKEFEEFKKSVDVSSIQYKNENNKEGYLQQQIKYWDFYYQHYPEYLPPTVSKGQQHQQFIRATVDMIDDGIFDTKDQQPEYMTMWYQLMFDVSLQIDKSESNIGQFNYDLFSKMMESYLGFIKERYTLMYINPKYSVMNEVLPLEFQLKVKLSEMAQIWIHSLTEINVKKFLEKYGLAHEYGDIEEPKFSHITCEDCNKEVEVVDVK